MLDNYPPGAANDPRAPYNQIPDEEHTRTVSLTVSFDYTVMGPSNASENDIKNWIDSDIRHLLKHNNLRYEVDNIGIDELEILDNQDL